MNPTRVDVFFYGSFINRRVLADHGLVPTDVRVARLPDFDITIWPLANLHAAPGRGAYGILVAATHDELARLYDYAERGLGGRYLPQAVIVELLDRGQLPAPCYIAPSLRPAPATAEYVERIVGPARELGFPADYIAHLDSFRPPAR